MPPASERQFLINNAEFWIYVIDKKLPFRADDWPRLRDDLEDLVKLLRATAT